MVILARISHSSCWLFLGKKEGWLYYAVTLDTNLSRTYNNVDSLYFECAMLA